MFNLKYRHLIHQNGSYFLDNKIYNRHTVYIISLYDDYGTWRVNDSFPNEDNCWQVGRRFKHCDVKNRYFNRNNNFCYIFLHQVYFIKTLDIYTVLWRCLLTVLITPTIGGQRHPTVWLFLCPFAKVKTLFDCGFLLYLHLLDAGCARYVQGFGLKAGSRTYGRWWTPGIVIHRRCQSSHHRSGTCPKLFFFPIPSLPFLSTMDARQPHLSKSQSFLGSGMIM